MPLQDERAEPLAASHDHAPPILGSRYADELNKGALSMKFPPELEREYHSFYLNERRSHVRSFNIVMCALVAVAALASILSDSAFANAGRSARLAMIAAAYGVMIWAAYSRRYEHVYLRSAHIASLIIAVVSAWEIAHRIHSGASELFGLLTAYSIGLYFLAGILYRAALRANVAMVIALGTALAMVGEPFGRVVYFTAMLAATAAIGGVAFRHQGIRFRRTFLERGIIAELAARDGLTGLKNRRAFDEHLLRVWQQALRDRRSFAVMLLDVDHFKMFNDRYGHQAGDQALKRIALVVNDFARRPLDLAARFGGEEFAIVLFDVSLEHVSALSEQLRAAIWSLQIQHSDHPAGCVTVSIGVAIVLPTLERSPQGAVQLADQALYAAKQDGRNRVNVFEREYDALSTGTFRIR